MGYDGRPAVCSPGRAGID